MIWSLLGINQNGLCWTARCDIDFHSHSLFTFFITGYIHMLRPCNQWRI